MANDLDKVIQNIKSSLLGWYSFIMRAGLCWYIWSGGVYQ